MQEEFPILERTVFGAPCTSWPVSVVERIRAAVAAGAQTREGELDLEASPDRIA